MDELRTKIQAVINTLEILEMPTTYNNVNRMLGIYNTLVEVRDSLKESEKAAEDGE